jgi:hypothetical protein
VYTPYYQFTQIILGNLYLNTPEIKVHTSFWSTLITVVIEAIAITVANLIAPGLGTAIGFVAGSFGALAVDAIVVGVTAGLIDAAGQGLAVGLGLQESISWKESAGVAITAGVTFGVGGGEIDLRKLSTQKLMFRAGKIAVAQQLAEMAVGLRTKFEVRAVLAAMASAGLTNEIGIEMKQFAPNHQFLAGLLSDTTTAMVTPLIADQPFDLEQIAATALGNTIGSYLGNQLGNVINDQTARLRSYAQAEKQSINYLEEPEEVKKLPSSTSNSDPEKARIKRYQAQAEQIKKKDWNNTNNTPLEPWQQAALDEFYQETASDGLEPWRQRAKYFTKAR